MHIEIRITVRKNTQRGKSPLTKEKKKGLHYSQEQLTKEERGCGKPVGCILCAQIPKSGVYSLTFACTI